MLCVCVMAVGLTVSGSLFVVENEAKSNTLDIEVYTHEGLVWIELSESVKWLSMEAPLAEQLAHLILSRAESLRT